MLGSSAGLDREASFLVLDAKRALFIISVRYKYSVSRVEHSYKSNGKYFTYATHRHPPKLDEQNIFPIHGIEKIYGTA